VLQVYYCRVGVLMGERRTSTKGRHGPDLIEDRLLLGAAMRSRKTRPFAIIASSVPRPAWKLVPIAPFGLAREQVVPVVFRKVAFVLHIQHGGPLAATHCYHGRPCRRKCAVTQRTTERVGCPEAALRRDLQHRPTLQVLGRALQTQQSGLN
jgi:hypothetical protein